ncbi:thioredoxin family protein [Rheinheimera sp.]|jgi:glutaredoxin|uniref:thioredoxin family protein n=1 Tax=Rheinheimera sp. TaxID=1869214 RepID=UPI002610F3C5|nr:thioredoxin family protein [Rheinheimera sp.]MCA1929135.1 thioredoxin family protein [Rheinheimera sp.]
MNTKTIATFYHAGCPVCISAEQTLLSMIDPNNYQINVVHLGEQSAEVATAKAAGIQSVPALVIDGQVLHINFGAAITDLA